ncbi:hypothetical protein NKG05_19735 [Oerskovia sp. M15]
MLEDDIGMVTAMPGGRSACSGPTRARGGSASGPMRTGATRRRGPSTKPAQSSALSLGNGMADDHMNVAVASDGTLYAAVKTSYDTQGATVIALLVRRPGGTWDPLRGRPAGHAPDRRDRRDDGTPTRRLHP